MSIRDEVIDIVRNMDCAFILLWNPDEGWTNVHSDGTFKFSCEGDVFHSLERYVQEDDLSLYRIFADKIKSGMKNTKNFQAVDEKRLNVAVHLKVENTSLYYNLEGLLMKDEDNAISGMIFVAIPLDAEEIYRIQLAREITNDRSPSMFIRAANEIFKKAPDRKYVLIQFDVAKFKAINEMYGESFGDEVLAYFLEALKVLCNQDQLYVRLTADVFMVMISYETKEDIIGFVEKLNSNLLGYKGVKYRLVFGVAEIEDLNGKLRKYGDRAALARQNIKANALEHIGFYEEGMRSVVLNAKLVEDSMEKALANHEFVMYLQPKFSIEHNTMVGAEALARWVHPDRGVIPPLQFIPVFEKNGFIVKMDAYIWEEACKMIRYMLDEGIEPIPISVNVSRVHLKNAIFITTLNNLVEQYQIPKRLLELEITETAEENSKVVEYVKVLKEYGYTLLMDDFGSGYSSLNTLKDTQFDVVKIDRGFLQDFIGSDRGQKIVEHTIMMTKSIGLDLVAEGVETEEQATFLSGCGCDTVQGFYYAKPMPVEEFKKMLNI